MAYLESDAHDIRALRERLERAEETIASLRGEVAQLRRLVQPLTPDLLERRLKGADAATATDPRTRHGRLPVRHPQ